MEISFVLFRSVIFYKSYYKSENDKKASNKKIIIAYYLPTLTKYVALHHNFSRKVSIFPEKIV